MEFNNLFIPSEIIIYLLKFLNISQQIIVTKVNWQLRNLIKKYLTTSTEIYYKDIMINDNVLLLKWSLYNNCTRINISYHAALKGYKNCLKYAHEYGCQWDSKIFCYIMRNGSLDCLKYARENGCEWNYMTCPYAALYGHLNCLKYAHENGCNWNSVTCNLAVFVGNLECLKYAYENGCEINIGYISQLTENSMNSECLKYIHEKIILKN